MKVTVVSFSLLPPLHWKEIEPSPASLWWAVTSLAYKVLSKISWWNVGGKVLSPNKGQHALGIRSYCRMQQPETVMCWTCSVLFQQKAKGHVLLIGEFKLNFLTLSQKPHTPLVRHQKCHNKVWNIVLRQTAMERQDKKALMREMQRWVGVFECSICWKRLSNISHSFSIAVAHFQLNCSWQDIPQGCSMTALHSLSHS